MVGNRVKASAIGLLALATLAAPAVSSAQDYAARCDESSNQRIVYDDYGRAVQTRPAAYGTNRVVARRSAVQSVERVPQRTKTKSALMIAGAAATGAGVGGAISGTKGALIGAAIGGGSASIYEAAKRR
jgi:hypothetical protein